MKQEPRLSTRLVHAGQGHEWSARTRAVPIYQTGSYIFQDADRAAKAFNLEIADHLYGRLSNPTTTVLESRMAAMDRGQAGVGFASGMAAITNTILNICQHGDTIISSRSLYGGTYVVFERVFKAFGITTAFVDPLDVAALEKQLVEQEAKLFFTEGIGNPKNDIPDFDRIASCCHTHHVPFILDNTLTPSLLDPSQHGLDLVIYSLSKYAGGHGVFIGGLVVDMGTFDWHHAKFPYFTEPDPTYNNLVFADQDTPFALRLRAHMLRNFGAPLSPFDAFLGLIGLETLALRMEKVCANAATLASRLNQTERVAWVNYPGVGAGKHMAERLHYFNGKGGGIICFGLGDAERSQKFADYLQLITHMANMGDTKTLIQHCASTSHAQLSEQELMATGTRPDLLRMSVGIEDVEDLWEDITTALARL